MTSVAEKFCKHLARLEDNLLVIAIENSDQPAAIEDMAYIEVSTGQFD